MWWQEEGEETYWRMVNEGGAAQRGADDDTGTWSSFVVEALRRCRSVDVG